MQDDPPSMKENSPPDTAALEQPAAAAAEQMVAIQAAAAATNLTLPAAAERIRAAPGEHSIPMEGQVSVHLLLLLLLLHQVYGNRRKGTANPTAAAAGLHCSASLLHGLQQRQHAGLIQERPTAAAAAAVLLLLLLLRSLRAKETMRC